MKLIFSIEKQIVSNFKLFFYNLEEKIFYLKIFVLIYLKYF